MASKNIPLEEFLKRRFQAYDNEHSIEIDKFMRFPEDPDNPKSITRTRNSLARSNTVNIGQFLNFGEQQRKPSDFGEESFARVQTLFENYGYEVEYRTHTKYYQVTNFTGPGVRDDWQNQLRELALQTTTGEKPELIITNLNASPAEESALKDAGPSIIALFQRAAEIIEAQRREIDSLRASVIQYQANEEAIRPLLEWAGKYWKVQDENRKTGEMGR